MQWIEVAMHAQLLWCASAVAALTWFVHTFVGGRYVARPLLTDMGLPKAAKWLAYYCWHLVTLMLVGLAALFACAAEGLVNVAVTAGLAFFCLGCSVLSGAVALKGGIVPWRFPSTLLFALIGVLGIAALLV